MTTDVELQSMSDTILTTIAVTGFTVALLHAAILTNWLPFVLAARVQKCHRQCAAISEKPPVYLNKRIRKLTI